MEYPTALRPVSTEPFTLPNGHVVRVSKACPRFTIWRGDPPFEHLKSTLKRKRALSFNGEPMFAEIATLRLLESAGWSGVWVDTFHRRYRVAVETYINVPAERAALLAEIEHAVGKRGGCFDLYAWRGNAVLFAELKLAGEDRIRPSQRRWLAGALACGLPVESFLVVEWDSLQEAVP